jgi:uncharacterized membrane protein YqjE
MSTVDRSLGTVVSDIVGDLQQIVRAEVRLAKVEVREELGKARRGAMFLVAGGLFLTLAFGLTLLAAVYALATIWPSWAAALAVAAGTALIGGVLAMSGKGQISSIELPPQKTVETVKENLQWAKTRTR